VEGQEVRIIVLFAESRVQYCATRTGAFNGSYLDHLHTYSQQFYVLLSVHPGMILVYNQPDAQFFISILYMFRAAMCPLSGELLYQCDTWFMSPCVD